MRRVWTAALAAACAGIAVERGARAALVQGPRIGVRLARVACRAGIAMRVRSAVCSLVGLVLMLAVCATAEARPQPAFMPRVVRLVNSGGVRLVGEPHAGPHSRRSLRRALEHPLSGKAALGVDAKFFPQALGQRAPAVLDPGGRKLKLLRRVNARVAEVRTAEGRRAVVQGSLPLFGVDSSGQTAPVNLALTDTTAGYQPDGALVPVEIPKTTSSGVNFPDSFVSIQLAAAAGDDVTGVVDGDSVFYPNIDGASADTDAVIDPTEIGADISWVLRSAASPKQLDLTFSMLPGWSLAAASDGGVNVLDELGQVQGHVMPPMTTDANGNTVPSRYVITGAHTLETQVLLSNSQPVAYPLLVDPSAAFGDFFNSTSDSSEQWWLDGYWTPSAAANFSAYNSNASYEEWTGTTSSYPAGAAAYYYKTEPAHTTAFGAQFFSIYNYAYATSTGGSTAETAGISDSNPSAGQWNDTAGGQGDSSTLLQTSMESNLGSQTFCVSEWTYSPSGQCPVSTAYPGDTVILPGIEVSGGAPKTEPVVASDGASIYETDNVTPAASSITHTVAPGVWINPKTNTNDATDQVQMTWSDTGGLGLQSEALSGANISSQTQTISCNGKHTSPCPTTSSPSFSYAVSSLPEGVNTITETATSLVGNVGSSSWNIDIDETPPTAAVTCTGAGSWSNAASSTCTVTGSDPADSSNGAAGSGLATLQYQTQTNGGAWSAATTITSGGTISVTPEGITNVRAIATDKAGNTYTSSSTAVELDRTAPTAAVSCPGSGAYTNTNVTCTITGSDPADASDAAAGSGLKQLAYETQSNGGSWSAPTSISSGGQFSVTTEGITNVRAIATDNATNTFTTASTPVEIDKTPPTATVTCAGNGAWTNTTPVACTITGTDPVNASNGTVGSGLATLTYETNLNGGGWTAPASVSTGSQINIANAGATQVQVIATDKAGNTFTTSTTVNIDTTPPNASPTGSLVQGNNTVFQPGTYTLGATVTDPSDDGSGDPVSSVSGVQSVAITVDGTAVQGSPFTANCSSSSCPASFTVPTYSYNATPGDHVIDITSTDFAGNSATYEIDVDVETPPAAQPTKNYNLLTDAGLRIDGANAGDLAGSSVTDIGDINGDGLEDYAIGAPHYNNGAGAVFVIYGRQGRGATLNLSNLSAQDGFMLSGSNGNAVTDSGDLAGTTVAAVGDVNDDGYSDFAIGAPGANDVYVVFGGPNLGAMTLSNIATAGPGATPDGFIIQGPTASATASAASLLAPTPNEQFGVAIGGAGAGNTQVGGDVNGDGMDDILVGYSGAQTSEGIGTGEAWVVYGKSDGTPVNLANLTSSQGISIDGGVAGGEFGQSVTMVGDINGDGYADIAVAAPNNNTGNTGLQNAGTVYIIYGGPSLQNMDFGSNSPASTGAGYCIYGATNDHLGYSTKGHGLADIGDVSSDGIDDLAIGGNGGWVVFLGQTNSNGNVDLGASGWPGYEITPPSGTLLGTLTGNPYSVSNVFAVGDLNGDGVPDLAITDPTANGNAGDAYVVYGKPDSASVSLSAISAVGASSGGELGFHVPGVSSGDQLGTDVTGIADSTGDGNSDLLLTAPGAGNNGLESGSTYLISIAGSTLPPVSQTQSAMSAVNTATAAASTTTTTTTTTTPLPPADPRGYGLSGSYQCVYGNGGCMGGDSTAFTDTSSTSTTPVNELIAARHMHIFRYGVDWMTFMTLPGKETTTTNAAGQTVVLANPMGSCGPPNSTSTAPNYSVTANCGGLMTFMQWVQAHEQQGTPVVEITMSRNYTNGAPYKAPLTPGQYETALERVAHYVNQVLYASDGGIHVRFWGAWNEPDNGNEPMGQSGPLASANYALGAHIALERHVTSPATATTPPKTAYSVSGTGCTPTTPCTVIAGTFANYNAHYNFDNRYVTDIRAFGRDKNDLWTPAIWSYHAYDDISTGTGMPSTFDMITHIKHQNWANDPQIWMDEGAAALMNGTTSYPLLDEKNPGVSPTNPNICGSVPDPVTAGVAPNISAAVQRFLAFTGTFTPTQLPAAAHANFGFDKQVAVALYYEFSSGGSGTTWASTPAAWCNVTLQNIAVPPGSSAPTTLSGFDSGLFESNGQLANAVANGTPGAVAGQLRPRYAYCVLAAAYFNPKNMTYFDPTTAQDTDCQAADYGTQEPDISQWEPVLPSGATGNPDS